jgi:hypothetical protein
MPRKDARTSGKPSKNISFKAVSVYAGLVLFNLDLGHFGAGFFRIFFLEAFDPVIQQ